MENTNVQQITNEDLKGIGVVGMEDIPGLTRSDMQDKLEETSRRVVIPKMNELIGAFNLLAEEVASLALGSGQVTQTQIDRWDSKPDSAINLLHNADWGYSLVNQRGHSGAISSEYCIDRWIGNGAVTPVFGQHVILGNGTAMTQRMEIIPETLVGKQCTFSIDVAGTTQSVQISFPSELSMISNSAELTDCSVELGFLAGEFTLCGDGRSYVPYIKITAQREISVKRVFLEFGNNSHMNKTPPTTYETNLNICKRYYVRWHDSTHRLAFPAFFNSATVARATITLPVIMRVSPACSIGTLSSTMFLWDSTAIIPSELSSVAAVNNQITLEFAVLGGTASKPAIMRFGQTTTVIFDADL